MDVASFKTVIDVQKKDMDQFLEDNNHSYDPEHNRQKSEWSVFFKEARTQSRKKTKKIIIPEIKRKGRTRKTARIKFNTGLNCTTTN